MDWMLLESQRLEKETAEADWNSFHQSGLATFRAYLDSLRRGIMHDNELSRSIASLRTVFHANGFGEFSRLLARKRAELLAGSRLPETIVTHFQPGDAPVAVIPLVTSSGALEGVLLADNKFTLAAIDDVELELLSGFGQIAAEAIGRWRRQSQIADWGTPAPVADATPGQILEEMLSKLNERAPYSGAAVLLTDEKQRPRDLFVKGMERPADPKTWMRPNGYSPQVIDTGRYVFLNNRAALAERVNPNVPVEYFPSSACLPFIDYRQRLLGVVWWYFAEDMVPKAQPLWTTLGDAIQSK